MPQLFSKRGSQLPAIYYWQYEIFSISKVKNTDPVTYSIKDYNGEVLKGSFYEVEVQKVNISSDIYPVEKIIQKKKEKGKLKYLVKWKGYSDAANSQIFSKP